MSTNYIQFHDKIRKRSLNICFLSYWKDFVGTEKRVRIIHGKRAIRVRAIEVILYNLNIWTVIPLSHYPNRPADAGLISSLSDNRSDLCLILAVFLFDRSVFGYKWPILILLWSADDLGIFWSVPRRATIKWQSNGSRPPTCSTENQQTAEHRVIMKRCPTDANVPLHLAALRQQYFESWPMQECQRGCDNSTANTCAWSAGW